MAHPLQNLQLVNINHWWYIQFMDFQMNQTSKIQIHQCCILLVLKKVSTKSFRLLVLSFQSRFNFAFFLRLIFHVKVKTDLYKLIWIHYKCDRSMIYAYDIMQICACVCILVGFEPVCGGASISFAHLDAPVLPCSSSQNCSGSVRLDGGHEGAATGPWSGLSHSRTLTLLFLSHSCVASTLCLGVLGWHSDIL